MRKKKAVEPVPKGLSDLTFEHVCVTCNRNGNRSTTLGEFTLLLKQCDEHYKSTKVPIGDGLEGGHFNVVCLDGWEVGKPWHLQYRSGFDEDNLKLVRFDPSTGERSECISVSVLYFWGFDWEKSGRRGQYHVTVCRSYVQKEAASPGLVPSKRVSVGGVWSWGDFDAAMSAAWVWASNEVCRRNKELAAQRNKV